MLCVIGCLTINKEKREMLMKCKYVWLLPVLFMASFANAGRVVMQGTYENNNINPRCAWVNNTPFKSLMCDQKKVIEYATYDRPGMVTYFNNTDFEIDNSNGLQKILSRYDIGDQLVIAGTTVMSGNYQSNTIGSNCKWQNNIPYKSLICSGSKVVEYALYERPGAVTYFNNKDFILTTTGGVQTIFYKSPFSDLSKDAALEGKFSIFTHDTVLDKPVIMVEGYDPNNSIAPNNVYNNQLKYGYPVANTGFKRLVYGGRDLFIVNFPHGDADLNTNAVLLQRIIQEINARKVGAHPLAVMGWSMGGVIARKALKNMEDAGIDHKTSLYVSYDAPHLGANSPVTLQEMVESLRDDFDPFTKFFVSGSLNAARNVYNSEAAKQMLLSGPNFVPATSAVFPVKPVMVGVTSGSMMGNRQYPAFVSGLQIASFDVEGVFGSVGIQWVTKPIKNIYYDDVPGSFEYQFDWAFNDLSSVDLSVHQELVGHKDGNWHPITFIPTTSALAIQGSPLVAARDKFKYYSPFDKFIAIDTTNTFGCTNYENQVLAGVNEIHNMFHASQMSQIICALNEYHKIGFIVPDRSFKAL